MFFLVFLVLLIVSVQAKVFYNADFTGNVVKYNFFEGGFNGEFAVSESVSVNINGEDCIVALMEVKNNYAIINISKDETIQVVLRPGEYVKADVDKDNIYDIYLSLSSIVDDRANITIKKIHQSASESMRASSVKQSPPTAKLEYGYLFDFMIIALVSFLIFIVMFRHKRK